MAGFDATDGCLEQVLAELRVKLLNLMMHRASIHATTISLDDKEKHFKHKRIFTKTEVYSRH